MSSIEAKVKEYYAGVRARDKFAPYTAEHNEANNGLLGLGLNGEEYYRARAEVNALRPYGAPQGGDYLTSLQKVRLGALREERDELAGVLRWAKNNPRLAGPEYMEDTMAKLAAVRAEIKTRSQVERYLADLETE